MCGRYHIDDETTVEIQKIINEVEKRTNVTIKKGEIFPTNLAPILIAENHNTIPYASAWGFPNFRNKGVIINARSETAFEKKTFRESLLSRRCIIPATGFYEWDKEKNKMYFTDEHSPIIYMAGLYQIMNGESRFVILTTGANSSMLDIHNRMPLILTKEQSETWLMDQKETQNLLSQTPILLKKELVEKL